MKLTYNAKKSESEILSDVVCDKKHAVDIEDNYLFYGDNICVMKYLISCGVKVDLIYIDPPFATKNVFRIGKNRISTISRSLSDDVAYNDDLSGAEFIEFLRERLIVARELLSERGSIYLHIDYKIGHYVKVMMDEVFGINNFRNDITRIKCNPKNFGRSAYGNIKDLILFYSKSNKPIWNNPVISYTSSDLERLYKKIDDKGRRYTTVPLHAPGETKNGETAKSFNGLLPPRGRHWRCSPAELEELDKQGLIEWSKNGVPRRIIYADEKEGKKMQDIWEFKDPQYPLYPTEKNLDLLKTIILASSNPDSVVLDFFCGSGTTLIAAEELGRKWIGIDSSYFAIETVKKRLNSGSLYLFSDYSHNKINYKNEKI